MPERLVVIGGVAAGMSAASRARKLRPEMEIVVLEKGRDVSYGACGLPYFVAGLVARPEELVVYDARFFREKRNIDVRLEHEAIAIEPGKKTVHALRSGSQPVAVRYDKLILATGAAPVLELPGSQRPNVFHCNTLAEAIRLRRFLEEHRPQRAVIIGSGYIGLEVAEALVRRGLEVTILERSNAVLDGIEPEIEQKLEQALAAHGVKLRKGAEAKSILGTGEGPAQGVAYGLSGHEAADLVVFSAGIRPRTELAAEAGIAIGPTGAIATDERMQTNLPGHYAAGDCAEVHNLVTGKSDYLPLGTTANKQGRVAGENAAGYAARFDGVVGTLVTRFFELGLARTGLSVAQARAHGFAAMQVTVSAYTRAKYFGGKKFLLTLIWDQASERVLGCQIAGEDDAAKRIDTAAMALHARMRIEDLLYVDLSYAPPFAPVWEALLVAANEARKQGHRA